MDNVSISARADAGTQARIALMISVGLIAHLALVWAWPYPPLVDWPNHMARHYLESRALAGEALPPGYEIRYSLTPNLGADLVVPVLLRVFPLTVASRIFLSFSVLTCWLGFGLFVGRQAAGSGFSYAASMLVLPWLLTQSFFMGFLNYTSGLGLAFLAFCNYLRLSEKCCAPPTQWVLHGGFVALLYVWHLAALGVYLVLYASHALIQFAGHGASLRGNPGVRRKIFLGLATLAPVCALMVAQSLMTTPVAVQGAIIWRGPAKKIHVALATMLTYNYALDAVVIAFFLAALVVMFRVEALRRLRFGWLPVATFLFLILYLGLPDTLGTTASVDTRVLAPLLICGIALIAGLPPRRVVAGAALAMIAALIRIGAVADSWERYARVDTQHMTFLRQLPVGARILALQFPYVDRFKNDAHVVAWAVPERQAMVSSLFAIPGQQPLRVTASQYGPFMYFAGKVLEIDAERIRAASFDYVWFFNASDLTVTVPATWSRVYARSSITIWQVR